MLKRSILQAIGCILALASVSRADEADVFSRIDKDGDGVVAASEVQESHRRLFDRLLRTADKNADGKLSRDEFVAGTTAEPDMADGPQRGDRFGGGGGRGMTFQPGQFLRRLDRDGDGKLSREETPERMRQGFDRLDANTDGYINGDELGRLARAFGDARPQNRPANAQPDQAAQRTFRERDANADGRITLDEVPEDRREEFKRMLSRFDLKSDDGLTLEQFQRGLRARQE